MSAKTDPDDGATLKREREPQALPEGLRVQRRESPRSEAPEEAAFGRAGAAEQEVRDPEPTPHAPLVSALGLGADSRCQEVSLAAAETFTLNAAGLYFVLEGALSCVLAEGEVVFAAKDYLVAEGLERDLKLTARTDTVLLVIT